MPGPRSGRLIGGPSSTSGRLTGSGPRLSDDSEETEIQRRIRTQRESSQRAAEASQDDGGGLFGILDILGGSLVGDIPLVPDFIEDAVLSPIGLASIALVPVTGGASLAGLATAGGRAGARAALTTGTTRQVASRGVRELGRRTAGEAVVGGAVILGSEALGDVLPEGTPGAVRIGLGLGAGAVAGTAALRAFNGRPVRELAQTSRNPEAILRTENDVRQFIQGNKHLLDEDSLVQAEQTLLEGLRVSGQELGEEASQRLIYALSTPEEILTNPIFGGSLAKSAARLPVVGRTVQRFVAPIHLDSLPNQAAIIAANRAESQISFLTGVTTRNIRTQFDNALPRRFEDVFSGPTVPEDIAKWRGIESPGKFGSDKAAGTVDHILQNPDDYVFGSKAIEDAFRETIKAREELFPILKAIDPNVQPITNFGRTQRIAKDFEDELSSLFTNQGKGPGRIRAEFERSIDLRRLDELDEEVALRLVAALEKNDPVTGFLLDSKDIARRFGEEQGVAAGLKAQGIDDPFRRKLDNTTTATLKAENKADKRAAKDVENRILRSMRTIERKTGAAGRDVQVQRERLISAELRRSFGIKQTGQKIKFVNDNIDDLERVRGLVIGLRGSLAAKGTKELMKSLVKGEINRTKGLRGLTRSKELAQTNKRLTTLLSKIEKRQRVHQNDLDRFDEALREVVNNRSKIQRAAERLEDAKTAEQRIVDFEEYLTRNIRAKEMEPFPDHLVPPGASSKRLSDQYNQLKDLRDGIRNREGLLEGGTVRTAENQRRFNEASASIRKRLKELDAGDKDLGNLARVADSMRELMLTLDMSVLTIQGLSAAIANPRQAIQNISRAIKFATSPEGFRHWQAAEMDRIQLAIRDGVNLFDHVPSEIATGLTTSRRPLIESVPGLGHALRGFNEAAYGRGVAYLKFQVYQNNKLALIHASKQAGFREEIKKRTGTSLKSDFTEADLGRIAANHANNTLGGQNFKTMGIGRNQRLLEKLFILTPDYLRSTLGVFSSAMADRGPKGALARRLLAGYFGLAAAGTLIAHEAFGGQPPNIFNPEQGKWLTLQIPNPTGGTLNMNPFSRFTSLFRPAAEALGTVRETGDVELGGAVALDGALQFAKGRQSAPLGLGLEVLTGEDFFGNPIPREEDESQTNANFRHIIRGLLPITIQAIRDDGIGLNLLPEFLGINTYSTSPQQEAVMSALAAQALNFPNVSARAVRKAIRGGRNPLFATDDAGRYYLTSDQREQALENVASITGLPDDVIFELGREQRTLSPDQLRAAEEAEQDAYFAGAEAIRREYGERLAQITAAVESNADFTHDQFRERLNEFRQDRSAQFRIHNDPNGAFAGVVEKFSDPDRLDRQNVFDVQRQQFNDERFALEFDDPVNGFDFAGSQEVVDRWRAGVGDALVDQFLDNPDLSPLERELSQAREILRPYWDITDSVVQRLTGGRFGNDIRAMPPAIARRIERLVNQEKERMRRLDPLIDAMLVKWYGNVPIRQQR